MQQQRLLPPHAPRRRCRCCRLSTSLLSAAAAAAAVTAVPLKSDDGRRQMPALDCSASAAEDDGPIHFTATRTTRVYASALSPRNNSLFAHNVTRLPELEANKKRSRRRKEDDEDSVVLTMPRWLGMFNEAEPSNISATAFTAQRSFANLFFHWDLSLLLETRKRLQPNNPGLFLSMQTWSVWHLPDLKWRNQNETGLKPHWRESLSAGLAQAEPYLRSGVLTGIFMGDELATQGIPFENITSVADAIQLTLAKTGGLVYLNEGIGPFDPQHPKFAGTWGARIPSSIDLFSIDDYCLLRPDKFDTGWPNCSDPTAEAVQVQRFLAEHVKPLMTPRQRLMVVPGLFLDANVSRSGRLTQQEQLMIQKLDAYFKWATRDELVVGLNGWHWTTLPDHRHDVQMIPFYWGVDHMKNLQHRLAQIGQLVNNTHSTHIRRKKDDGEDSSWTASQPHKSDDESLTTAARVRSRTRVYAAALSPRNHPLFAHKVTRPPELTLFGSGSACSGVTGCTGFKMTAYTSSDPVSGNLTGNATDILLAIS